MGVCNIERCLLLLSHYQYLDGLASLRKCRALLETYASCVPRSQPRSSCGGTTHTGSVSLRYNPIEATSEFAAPGSTHWALQPNAGPLLVIQHYSHRRGVTASGPAKPINEPFTPHPTTLTPWSPVRVTNSDYLQRKNKQRKMLRNCLLFVVILLLSLQKKTKKYVYFLFRLNNHTPTHLVTE